jgi:hypothetical protein
VTLRIIVGIASALILADCNTPGGISNTNAPALPSGMIGTPSMPSNARPGSVYIASQDNGLSGIVAVYKGRRPTFVRSFQDGLVVPQKIIFNSHRQLMVANYSANDITFYPANGSKPIRTLSEDLEQPYGLAISSNNNLYAIMGHQTNIYFNSQQRRVKEIQQGALDIVVDTANNVYISTSSGVNVYAPGATLPSRVINEGMNDPRSLLLDSSGNLYVSNAVTYPTFCGYVTVYDAATGTLKYTIKDGICNSGTLPGRMTMDASGDLFVCNEAYDTSRNSGTVTEYAAGTNSLIETISKGGINPIDLVVDSYGNLYVANFRNEGASNVTVYAPGKTSPSETLTKGIYNPISFAWLPNN